MKPVVHVPMQDSPTPLLLHFACGQLPFASFKVVSPDTLHTIRSHEPVTAVAHVPFSVHEVVGVPL